MKITVWLLVLSEILFLTTFLAAEPLELLADSGQLANGEAVYLYASRWRHGMTPDSVFYMPGFFAVALTVWFWALRRPLPQLLREGCMLTLAALAVASLLQPWVTADLLDRYQADTGAGFSGPVPGNTLVGVFRSIYTLLTFAIGIVSIQAAIARLRLWPLALPVVMNVVLSQVRPWTVDDFTSYWMRQTLDLDPVAVLSTLSVVSLSLVMVLAQVIVSRRDACKRESLPTRARPSQGPDTSESMLNKSQASGARLR